MFKKFFVLFVVLSFMPMPIFAESIESPDEINMQKFAKVKEKVKSIDVSTLNLWIKNDKKFILLDVREPAEINAVSIIAKNSMAIPRGVVDFSFHRIVPDKEATVVVYCSHGNRSAVVTDIINGYGYKNIYNLKDGIFEWISAGYPIENFYGSFEMKKFKPKF